VIELRPSVVEDLPHLLKWVSSEEEMRVWSGPGFLWPLSTNQLRAYFEESRSGQRLLWSADAIKDGALVGHASLALKAEGAVGRLGRVLVDPARRGEGLGRALVTSAVTAGFAQTRIDTLTLGVYRHNTAAHQLYESIGFLATQTPIAATTIGDRSWDSIEMQLPRRSFVPTKA
jgi:RimJ/RimL family protein N-acetyltransferase